MTAREILDFDRVETWEPSLSSHLSKCVSKSVRAKVRRKVPAYKYIEDARDGVLQLAGKDKVIDAVLEWISASTIHGYHGSRLRPDEIQSIRNIGLTPLEAMSRRGRLERALSSHARWDQVKESLDDQLRAHGPGKRAGGRENQVHLTLSRSGLVNSFNHYIAYGSEFDQRVAQAMLGQEGIELLALDGKPVVIDFIVPGDVAISAAHPYLTPADVRSNGDVPNLVGEFLEVWSSRLANPDLSPASLKIDSGMVFRMPVPAEWIVDVEEISDATLSA